LFVTSGEVSIIIVVECEASEVFGVRNEPSIALISHILSHSDGEVILAGEVDFA
jgi:hypothetical protein